MLVLDASIVVKVFVEEAGTRLARSIWGGNDVLAIPAHGFAEVGEVLARKCRKAEVASFQAEAALKSAARSLLSLPIEPAASEAVALALGAQISVYDALYVVLADTMRCSLVTADEKLVAKLRDTRFAALMHPLDLR